MPNSEKLREALSNLVAETKAIGQHLVYNAPTSAVSRALEAAERALSQSGGGDGWRPEVRAFADLMEAQLRANDHKPGWKGEDPWPLMYRLREETVELHECLLAGSRSSFDAWASQVGAEAADVANFAMMIADVCGALPAAPSPQVKP